MSFMIAKDMSYWTQDVQALLSKYHPVKDYVVDPVEPVEPAFLEWAKEKYPIWTTKFKHSLSFQNLILILKYHILILPVFWL